MTGPQAVPRLSTGERHTQTDPVLGLAALAGFVLLALDVALQGPASALDPAITRWWVLHREPGLTQLFLALSAWHGTLGIDLMLAAAALALLWRGARRHALWLVASVQGAMLLNVGLKLLFQRARPVMEEPLVSLATYSFPSGHALATTVWWGSVALLWASARGTRLRRPAVPAFVLVAAICTARVYLGAHFATDVVAGVLEGVAWLCVVARWGPHSGSGRHD